MAELIGVIASAITIGASAAQVSLALFSVVHTLKNAPKQIAEIAEELSLISESLQTLADVLRLNQDVCKPALFKNTHIIISRYKQVDAEIKKLTETPQKLAGLQWYFNKPKAKGLLKKVEGIKTALILELNIIRLAREELTRPYSDTGPSISVGLPPKFNRFRKVVESAVQANRKVVENAQQVDEDSRNRRRDYTNAGLDIWKENSFDTATWLYHLVFSPDIPNAPDANAKNRRLHQASVADGSASSDEETTFVRPETDTDEKAMIVWNRQTEPSLVVDRLLSSWTTLSLDQITRSAANQDGDEWREGLLKNIEEAKKEDELSFSQWEKQNDEEFKNVGEDSVSGITMPTLHYHSNTNNRRTRRGWRDDPWSDQRELSPVSIDTRSDRTTVRSSTSRPPAAKRPSREQHVRWKSDESSEERSPSRPPRYERQPGLKRPLYGEIEGSSSRVSLPRRGHNASSNSIPRRSFPNPFDPNQPLSPPNVGHVPPWQDPFRGTPLPSFDQRPSNPFSNPTDAWADWASPLPPHYPSVPPPPPPLRPYPQPPLMDTYVPYPPPGVFPEEGANKAEKVEKEKAIITAIEDLLEKRGQDNQLNASEPRFLKLMELLSTQQERELQSERERSNAATEAQMKLMQTIHDKDKERLKQLEALVEELRSEETHLRRLRQEETEERVQEARDIAAKEIAAVQSAREEAEKQTQQRADARADAELKKLKRNHKKELERYENLLREFQQQQAKSEQDAQQPIRRTRIAEGNRSVDVTEYSTDKRNPFHKSPSHLKGLQYGFAQLGINFKQPQAQRQYPRHSRRDSFRSSSTSVQSSHAPIGTANTSNLTESSQQLIIFPAKADRGSQEITRLQSSLASLGIESVFEDPEYESGSQLIPYNHDDSGDQLVRSTIFWEAPTLTLGSELLLTMRQAGWRPVYTRISEKGQTWFLGNQPIHAYFFSPDYKPQFSHAVDLFAEEFILIHKNIVKEYALIELGFEYEDREKSYVLDGKLTYNDIETLVERSFLMDENDHRRLHRNLQSHFGKAAKEAKTPKRRFKNRRSRQRTPSVSSTASAASKCSGGDNCTACGSIDSDAEEKESSVASTAGPRSQGDSDCSDRASTLSRDESTAKTPSIISWASKSTNNPFRQHMLQVKEIKQDIESESLSANIWDDPVAASLV